MDESQLNLTEFEEVVFHDPIDSRHEVSDRTGLAVVACTELEGST